jgi:hypothetical protein
VELPKHAAIISFWPRDVEANLAGSATMTTSGWTTSWGEDPVDRRYEHFSGRREVLQKRLRETQHLVPAVTEEVVRLKTGRGAGISRPRTRRGVPEAGRG